MYSFNVEIWGDPAGHSFGVSINDDEGNDIFMSGGEGMPLDDILKIVAEEIGAVF